MVNISGQGWTHQRDNLWLKTWKKWGSWPQGALGGAEGTASTKALWLEAGSKFRQKTAWLEEREAGSGEAMRSQRGSAGGCRGREHVQRGMWGRF